MSSAGRSPPEPVGYDIVRGNTFRYCGIEGLGGTGGTRDVLVERNLFEWIGWQDAAMMSESGGTKMHTAHNLLFRNNVVRHTRHGNGIWLDIGNANANVRITGNVFAGIPGNVNPHAVHIEGSDELNQIDNNIFSKLTGGILIRDTNNVIVAYIRTLSYMCSGAPGLNSLLVRNNVVKMGRLKQELKAAPAYTYYFTWQTPMLDGIPGAWHTSDLQFCFDNTEGCEQGTGNTPEAQALARKMATAWANFARTGNPSQPGLQWQPTDPAHNQTMIFDTECHMVEDPEGEARKLLLS
jgi:hypothetical protein